MIALIKSHPQARQRRAAKACPTGLARPKPRGLWLFSFFTGTASNSASGGISVFQSRFKYREDTRKNGVWDAD